MGTVKLKNEKGGKIMLFIFTAATLAKATQAITITTTVVKAVKTITKD